MNDDSCGTYNTNSQIKFKTSMLKSSLCDYSDAYIFVSETITVPYTVPAAAAANNFNKKVNFKNCPTFTDCTSEINNTQVDNAKDIDAVIPLHHLIEYSGIYLKTSESLWQYCRDKPAVNDNGFIVDFNAFNVTDSFYFKEKITGQTDDNGTKNVEIMVPLKYLSNFCRTLQIPLINCEINLILTWSANCVIVSTAVANQGATFAMTDTKLYVPVLALSTQDNVKLLDQLKLGFKRKIK